MDLAGRSGGRRVEGEDSKVYGRAFGADYYQTSELFMGSIAVGVILPDCPERAYTEDEVNAVRREVRECMEYWASVAGEPGVSFVYDVQAGIPCSRDFSSVAPHVDEGAWVAEIMEQMGYILSDGEEACAAVYEYIDTLRTRHGTEWGICMFIPKIESFESSYRSYGYLGGPYAVAPSGTMLGYRLMVEPGVYLASLLIREVGHLFWALDEHSLGTPCHMRSGYLGEYNRNSLNRDYYCDPRHYSCCMEIPAPVVCQYTLAQMGVRDQDEDGIPDVLDTHPTVEVETLADTVTTLSPTITGEANVMPLPNLAGSSSARNEITYNTIEHVIYRIDQRVTGEGEEEWLYADPEDGWGGDSTRLHFSFAPDSLTGGDHTITVRAVNTCGNTSDSQGEKRIDVFVKGIAIRDLVAEPDQNGAVKLSFRVRGESFGAEACVYRVVGGGERLFSSFSIVGDSSYVLLDTDLDPVSDTITYRLELSALGLEWIYEAQIVKAIAIHDFVASPSENDAVELHFRVEGVAGEAEATVYRSSGEDGEVHLTSFPLEADSSYLIHDEGPIPTGETITYRLAASAGGFTWNYETDILKGIAIGGFTAEPYFGGAVKLSFGAQGIAVDAEGTLYRSTGAEEAIVCGPFPLEADSSYLFYDEGPSPAGETIDYRLDVTTLGLTWTYRTAGVAPAPIPMGEHLSKAAPNPFRTSTVISYRAPRGGSVDKAAGKEMAQHEQEAARVAIDIFNVAGRLVRSFSDLPSQEGFCTDPLIWDGCDDSGGRLPAGVYLLRYQAGDVTESRKIIFLP